MRNQLNNIIFGLINQPQIWITHEGNELFNVINYLILGMINQPQLRIENTGGKMTDEISSTKEEDAKIGKKEPEVNVRVQGGSSGAVYGLGVIGACIYYISRGTTYQEKAIGFLKALVWPVFLVKEALEFLHKE
jgi:hypothetical protein